MLALDHYRSLVHEPCGGYLPDIIGEAAAGRFEAESPIRCELCTARSEMVKAYMNSDHAPHPQALLWPVERRRRARTSEVDRG